MNNLKIEEIEKKARTLLSDRERTISFIDVWSSNVNENVKESDDGETFDYEELCKLLTEANHLWSYKVEGKGKNIIETRIGEIVNAIINPIVEKQIHYNMKSVQTLNEIRRFIEKQYSINEEQTLQFGQGDRILHLENENGILKQRIAMLERDSRRR